MRRVISKQMLLKEKYLLLRAETARLKAQEEKKPRRDNVIDFTSVIESLQNSNIEERREARKVLSF